MLRLGLCWPHSHEETPQQLEKTMKFVSYNIQYGFGLDGRYDLERLAAAVEDADVIALQEVERHWLRSGEDDQPAILSSLLPDHYWVFGPGMDFDASYRDETGKLINRRRQFGSMLLSRTPIRWSRLHRLPMRATVGALNTQNQALEGLIETPSGPVRVLSLHLSHIGDQERLEQLEMLHAHHQRIPFEGGPWSGIDEEPERSWTNGEDEPACPISAIWMGDFNSQPGGIEYQRMTGTSPYYTVPGYRELFVDSTVAAGHAPDAFISHTGEDDDGVTRSRRLDFCFVSSDLAPRVNAMWVDQENIASDHKPVWTEIDFSKSG